MNYPTAQFDSLRKKKNQQDMQFGVSCLLDSWFQDHTPAALMCLSSHRGDMLQLSVCKWACGFRMELWEAEL